MNYLERLAPFAFVLVALSQTVPAIPASHAGEPSAADVATARELFRKGVKHVHDSEWQQAIEAFERSMALRPSSLTRYSLAVAQERLGNLVESMENLRQFLRDADQESTRPYEMPARDMVAQLEARIARVKIVIPGEPRGAQVRIDGREIPAAAIGVDRIVNPGRHRVEVAIPGHALFRREIELEQGGRLEVVVRTSQAAQGSALGLEPVAESGEHKEPPDATPIVLVTAGGAAFAGGLVVGLIGYGKAKDASARGGSEAQSARELALVGDLAMGAGLVAAGAGTYLWWIDQPETTARSWVVTPWAWRSTGGLGVHARF
ncbi:MAG: PEGA domain-containing protein [Polyangiaceae bacterium]|nr:PEGA domain-containing protein [Polyangiaceae bacterium]